MIRDNLNLFQNFLELRIALLITYLKTEQLPKPLSVTMTFDRNSMVIVLIQISGLPLNDSLNLGHLALQIIIGFRNADHNRSGTFHFGRLYVLEIIRIDTILKETECKSLQKILTNLIIWVMIISSHRTSLNEGQIIPHSFLTQFQNRVRLYSFETDLLHVSIDVR